MRDLCVLTFYAWVVKVCGDLNYPIAVQTEDYCEKPSCYVSTPLH